MEKRPFQEKSDYWLKTGLVCIGAVWVVGMLVLGAVFHHGDYFLWSFLPAAAGAAYLIWWANAREKAADRNYQGRVYDSLVTKYQLTSTANLLYLDVLFETDFQKKTWQGALLGVMDGQFVVLSESQELRIPLPGPVELTKTRLRPDWSEPVVLMLGLQTSGGSRHVYLSDTGIQPDGRDGGISNVGEYLRDMLTKAGAEVEDPKALPEGWQKRLLVRGPVSLVSMAAGMLLVREITGGKGFTGVQAWNSFLFLMIVTPVLWRWSIGKTGKLLGPRRKSGIGREPPRKNR